MPNYRRYRVPGGTYFFTVNLLERHRTLLVDEVALLRRVAQGVRARYPFQIDAWVVLPDHMHCIWTMPPNDADFAIRWQLSKFLFSKSLPPLERRIGDPAASPRTGHLAATLLGTLHSRSA